MSVESPFQQSHNRGLTLSGSVPCLDISYVSPTSVFIPLSS